MAKGEAAGCPRRRAGPRAAEARPEGTGWLPPLPGETRCPGECGRGTAAADRPDVPHTHWLQRGLIGTGRDSATYRRGAHARRCGRYLRRGAESNVPAAARGRLHPPRCAEPGGGQRHRHRRACACATARARRLPGPSAAGAALPAPSGGRRERPAGKRRCWQPLRAAEAAPRSCVDMAARGSWEFHRESFLRRVFSRGAVPTWEGLALHLWGRARRGQPRKRFRCSRAKPRLRCGLGSASRSSFKGEVEQWAQASPSMGN